MNVVCIDDKPLALESLSLELRQICSVEIVNTYVNAFEGLANIIQDEVDVVFLEVKLPEIKGIDLARKIIEKKPDVLIVFLTAYKEYAVEAFELEATDYIVKPVQLKRLQSTIERAKRKLHALRHFSSNKETKLSIKVSNHLAFSTDGKQFSPLQWRTTKAEELFLYLLHNRGHMVDKFTIKEVLWGDFDVADGLLHTTISNIRKALKEYKDHIKVRLRGNAYFLEMKQVQIDLFHWEDELNSLGRSIPKALEKYEKIMKLNQGVYLKQYSYIWLESERERLEQLWTETMKQMASLYVIENEVNKAFSIYHSICERQPTNEEVHFLRMKLYAKNGYVKEVSNQYEELTRILQKQLDCQPSEYIRQWYDNFMFVLHSQ